MNYVIHINIDKQYDALVKSVEAFKNHGVPLLLTTAKTRATVEKIQSELGINEPFITESGAGIFFPQDYIGFDLSSYPRKDCYTVVSLGKSYDFIVTYLETIKDKYSIKTLSSDERDFSVLFSMEDESLALVLNEEARIYGLSVIKKDPLFYCIGKMQDEEKALQSARAIFRRNGYDNMINIEDQEKLK